MNYDRPDYQRGNVRLYLGDCLALLPQIPKGAVDACVTDPPYGIKYQSSMTGHNGGTSLPGICGDDDASLRDAVVEWLGDLSAIIFGSWKVAKPRGCRAVLTWEKGDHVGMGDLSLPWKPNTEEIYVLGCNFSGHRGRAVLRFNAPVSWNAVRFGRVHPHEKPIELMDELIGKTDAYTILDPFLGSGTTAVACVRTGRAFVGCEIEPKYFKIACERMDKAFDDFALLDPVPPAVTNPELFA